MIQLMVGVHAPRPLIAKDVHEDFVRWCMESGKGSCFYQSFTEYLGAVRSDIERACPYTVADISTFSTMGYGAGATQIHASVQGERMDEVMEKRGRAYQAEPFSLSRYLAVLHRDISQTCPRPVFELEPTDREGTVVLAQGEWVDRMENVVRAQPRFQSIGMIRALSERRYRDLLERWRTGEIAYGSLDRNANVA